MPHPRRKWPIRMRRTHPKRPPGSSPGTLVMDPAAPKPRLRLIAYSPDRIVETELESPDEVQQYMNDWPVLWLNIDGLGDETTLRRVAELFDIHKLTLEDIVNVYQRPKIEPYPKYLYIVNRVARLDQDHLDIEQISLVISDRFVVTFQERTGDCFDQIRQRLRDKRGSLRDFGPDYLCYALIDSIIDAQFPLLESFGDRIEGIEDSVLMEPSTQTVSRIFDIKHDLLDLRRAIWPQREAISLLLRDRFPPFHEETLLYMRDCYDHTIQIADMIETYRELTSGMMDLYLSSVSNRLNEIMKVLTIFAVLFIPLTFIVGLYGMNFDPDSSPWNMPELRWYYGYPASLAVMVLTVLGLLWYFRRKGWLGGNSPSARHRRAMDSRNNRT